MVTKVSKWGNSLGLRLPKFIIDKMLLEEGSEVVITNESGKIVIEPKKKDLTMAELLADMSSKKVMAQFQPMNRVGKENVWDQDE